MILDLGEIETIKGDFTIKNVSSLIIVQANNLNTIEGNFELNTLTSLHTIDLPALEYVDSITWKVLPVLSKVGLDTGIKQVQSITMSDTSLTGFGGFNVESLRTLNINNNRFLEKIESSVQMITDEVLISANAKELQVLLPNLSSVKSLTIKETNNINLQSLQNVESSAEFINNKFTALKLPKLKTVGNTLSIMGNDNLKDLEFSLLSSIGGGLIVVDNEKVRNVSFFPTLKTIGGAVKLQGNIDNTSFKGLKIVKGSAIVKSSSVNFDCDRWIKNEVGNVVRGGKVECGNGGDKKTQVVLISPDGESTAGTPGINDEMGKSVNRPDAKTASGKESFGIRTSVSPLFCITGILVSLVLIGF